MQFIFKVWKLTITLDLFDLDVSDRKIQIGISVTW